MKRDLEKAFDIDNKVYSKNWIIYKIKYTYL